jgi:hypothetical protein
MRSLSFFSGFTDRRDTTSEKLKNQAIRKFTLINLSATKGTKSTKRFSIIHFVLFVPFVAGFLKSVAIAFSK